MQLSIDWESGNQVSYIEESAQVSLTLEKIDTAANTKGMILLRNWSYKEHL